MTVEADKEAQILEMIISSLISKSYCGDFLEPALSRHPELSDIYLQMIEKPMDLGTILSKVKNREYKSFRECGAEIALVFQNSLLFNSQIPSLMSITTHAMLYIQRLWANIYDLPILLTDSLETFHQAKYPTSLVLYRSARQLSLTPSERRRLDQTLNEIITQHSDLHFLEDISSTHSDTTLSHTLSRLAQLLSSQVPGEILISTSRPQCSFLEVELSTDEWLRLSTFLTSNSSLAFSLSHLDRLVNELCLHLLERETRGSVSSSVWARPFKLVWAQPNKSPWWPGMVIAGHDVPSHLETINLSRIPTQILSALNRLRPKSKSTPIDSTHSSFPNYYIVEFFGPAHDFGWVRADSVLDFHVLEDGSIPIDIPGDQLTDDTIALEQALDAYSFLSVKRQVDNEGCIESPSLALDDYISKSMKSRAEAFISAAKTTIATATATTPGKDSKQKKKKSDVGSTAFALALAKDPTVKKRDFAVQQAKKYAEHFQTLRPIVPSQPTTTSNKIIEQVLVTGATISTDAMDTVAEAAGVALTDAPNTAPLPLKPDGTAWVNELTSLVGIPTKLSKKRKTAPVDENTSENLISEIFPSQEPSCSRLVSHHQRPKSSTCPVIHSREVNFDAKVFHLESRCRERRKEILRAEIAHLTTKLAKMTDPNLPYPVDDSNTTPPSPQHPQVELEKTSSASSSSHRTPKANIRGIRVGLAGRGGRGSSSIAKKILTLSPPAPIPALIPVPLPTPLLVEMTSVAPTFSSPQRSVLETAATQESPSPVISSRSLAMSMMPFSFTATDD
jgi:hypothetical protein